MTLHHSKSRSVELAVIILAAFAAVHCGNGSTPTAPTGPAMSSVTLSSSSVGAGGTVQGVVNLTAVAAAEGATVSLSSTNRAVATVPASVVVAAGSTSAAFTVTAVSPGTAAITASFNGTSQGSTLTVTGAAVLVSLSLSATSVVGGNPVVGTVTLNGTAPANGARVTLSGADPVTVPAAVSVQPGQVSATFTASTRAVGGTIPATITGFYGGASASAVLAVQPFVPTVATARFGVTGKDITDTCRLIDNGNSLECTFNGSTSTAPGTIVAWDWSYTSATTISQTTTGPVLATPGASCAFVPPPPLPAGAEFLPMTVKLTIRDSLGNVSAEAVNSGVRLLPQGSCGY